MAYIAGCNRVVARSWPTVTLSMPTKRCRVDEGGQYRGPVADTTGYTGVVALELPTVVPQVSGTDTGDRSLGVQVRTHEVGCIGF